MTDDDKKAPIHGEDLKIEFSPQAQAKIDSDPSLAEAMKDMQARFRQAFDDVATGKYASVDEAFLAMGAVPVDFDEGDDEDDDVN